MDHNLLGVSSSVASYKQIVLLKAHCWLAKYHIEIHHRDTVTVICNYISENKGQFGYLTLTLLYRMKREAFPEVIHPTVTWGWIHLHTL